jgi:hypothetical protein
MALDLEKTKQMALSASDKNITVQKTHIKQPKKYWTYLPLIDNITSVLQNEPWWLRVKREPSFFPV